MRLPLPFPALAGVAIGALVTGFGLPAVVDESDDVAVRSRGDGSEQVAGADGAAGDDGLVDGGSSPSAGGPAGTGSGSSGGSAGATGRGGGPGSPAATAAGPEVGVTGDSIKVGFLVLDIASATRIAGGLTGIDPEQQRRAIQAYVDDLNGRGGIGGRKVVPAYRTFDVLSADDQRAACLELTRDQKVFAIIAAGGFGGPPILCVTKEHGTPLINLSSAGTPRQYVDQSGGMLFTLFQIADRQMAAWVAELDRVGALQGKRIGVLSDDSSDPGDLVVGPHLMRILEDKGHNVVHRSRLDGDLAVGASQINVEVQQMRTSGAEVVLLPAFSTYASQFVGAADRQGWQPKWYVSDFANMSSQAIAANMPESFEGSLATTVARTGEDVVNRPEPQVDAACRRVYEQATGETLPRMKDGEYNNTYGTTLYACGMISLLERAAAAAGSELTRPGFSAAMQRLGAVSLPRFGGGAFGVGKFDASDLVRTLRWHADCTCWKPADEFHPVP